MSEDTKLSVMTLDGIEYKASPEVVNAYKKAAAKIEETQAKYDAATSEVEKLKAQKDDLKQKLDEASKVDIQAKVAEGVKVRVALIEDAKTIMGNKFEDIKADSKTDDEIRKEVVKIKCDGVNVDEKSKDYIQARFDMLAEAAKDEPSEGFKKQVEKSSTKHDSASANDISAARERLRQNTMNAWKPKAEAK